MSPFATKLSPQGAAKGRSRPGQPRAAQPPEHRTSLRQRLPNEAAWNAALCEDDHRARTTHEPTCQSSCFAGYHPVADRLYELRRCHRCDAMVSRPVRFIDALCHLLAQLRSPHQPSEIVIRSASLLVSWAGSNLPAHLGIARQAPRREQTADIALPDQRTDWRQFGLKVRKRRENADLTREQLSTRAGIAHATLRNLERGRHRPTARTLRRLVAVPALRLSELRDLDDGDNAP